MTHKIKGFIFLLMSLWVVTGLAACTPAQPASSPSGVNLSPSALPVSTQSPVVPPAAPPKKVSGVGTIDVPNYANLYFGSAGQIETINVQEGDRVTRGTILAKLDTADLEASLAQARVARDQAQLAQAQAQTTLDQAKLSQIQANSSLTTAQFYRDQIKEVSDIEDTINQLQTQVDTAQANKRAAAASGSGDATTYSAIFTDLQNELDQQQKKLAILLTGTDYAGAVTYNIGGQTYDRLTVENARMREQAVEAAQKAVDISANGIAIAQKYIDQSTDGIALAQKNLDLIMKHLDQATISASFDGQVASVNQRAGDFISVPVALQKPVIYLIDTSSFELVIGVNELDVPQVKVGQKAIVSIDAFPDIELDGQVSAISPAPTIRGSIVNYDVKITFSVPNDMGVRVGMNAAAEIATN